MSALINCIHTRSVSSGINKIQEIMIMKKLLLIFSICLASTLVIPLEDVSADIYKDIAKLKKQSKKQRGDIKLLKLRLEKLEQTIRNNHTHKKQPTATPVPAKKSGIITYP